MAKGVYVEKLEYFEREIRRSGKTAEEAEAIYREWNEFLDNEETHDIAWEFGDKNWDLMEMMIMELP